MRNPFKLDPPECCTHYARFYGIPAYYGDINGEGCHITGRYIGCDFLIEHLVPMLQWGVETLRALRDGPDYEPCGWMIEVGPPIQR
jgi:hypothetical protein